MPPRASPATTVPAISGGRPSSLAARSTSPPRSRSRIRVEETPSTSGTGLASKPRPLEQREIACTATAEAEVRAGDDHLGADRAQDALGERLRRELRQLEVEVDDERLLDPGLGEQLEPPLERHQQLDAVAERLARVRVEGDHRRRPSGGERGVEHAPVAEVDAVEGAERDRARLRLELIHLPGDVHSRASASSAVSRRSGSASSTRNGPTSVRRNVLQWPPSAVAIART